MNILISGARGMLGSEVVCAAQNAGWQTFGVDREEFDLRDRAAMKNYIVAARPDAVVHCAAFTDVDACETDEKNAFEINAMASRDIAAVCEEINAKIIIISTDYVFNGLKSSPYNEYDQPDPINVYGMSKYYAERYVLNACRRSFVVRTSWLFGKNGKNFVETILNLVKVKDELNVVNDQIGSPTYTRELAGFLIKLAQSEKYGIYHATNEGYCSWYDFAQQIKQFSENKNIKINAVSSAEFKRPALRPKNSMLSKKALYYSGFGHFKNWQEALADYFNNKKTGKPV